MGESSILGLNDEKRIRRFDCFAVFWLKGGCMKPYLASFRSNAQNEDTTNDLRNAAWRCLFKMQLAKG